MAGMRRLFGITCLIFLCSVLIGCVELIVAELAVRSVVAIAEHQKKAKRQSKEASQSSESSGSTMVWCATSSWVRNTQESYCKSNGGKSYWSKYLAETEHKRLKKQTTTASTSGSNGARWCANKYRFFRMSSWQSSCGSTKSFSTRYQAEAEHQRLKKKTTTASTSGSNSVWCAHKQSFWKASKGSACGYGKTFSTRYQAEAEHKRLKKQTTTASTSGSKNVWCASASSVSVYWTSEIYCKNKKNQKGFSSKSQAEREHKRLKASSANSSAASSLSSEKIWCAHSGGISDTYQVTCRAWGGKAYNQKYLAEAEHQRLKKQTTIASTSSKVWCATKGRVWSTNASCGSGVRVFSNKAKAQAEHKRLKEIATASSNQAPQETAAQTVSAEIVFWQSIKDSNDPDMFRAYLKKYPEGVYAELAEIKINKLSNTAVANVAIPNLDYGNYHALVIGNNRYRNFGDLNTPINDARTIARVLKSNYGFKVNVLEDATESRIFKAIINLRSTVGRNDNVLIYYGGHGELDNVTDEGFWIPSDAKRGDLSTYLAVDRIRKQIKAMPAKHVMVVADSCFAGSLTRSTLTRALKVRPRSPEYRSELQRLINKKSRTALVSGGLEPVLDSGSDGHSVFAGAFISALEDNDGVLDAHMLFIQVRENVRNNSPQNPEYSPIYETGHDHGDFLFVRQ
jgi:hypothetical protein